MSDAPCRRTGFCFLGGGALGASSGVLRGAVRSAAGRFDAHAYGDVGILPQRQRQGQRAESEAEAETEAEAEAEAESEAVTGALVRGGLTELAMLVPAGLALRSLERGSGAAWWGGFGLPVGGRVR